MGYKYKDPVSDGFEKFCISRKDQDKIFEYRKSSWLFRYEFYVKDKTIKMYKIPNLLCCVISTVMYPFAVIAYGVSNYKEVYKESILRVWFCKEYGAFSADQIYKREGNDGTFDKVIAARQAVKWWRKL